MKRTTIFITDDDYDDYDFLKSAFDELDESYEIRHYINGKELINTLDNCSLSEMPEVIILDINMPKMNGITTLEYIKTGARLKHIPVVMYTTTNDPEQIKQCYVLGANGFITKGTTLESVKACAKNVCNYLKVLQNFPGNLAVLHSCTFVSINSTK